MVGDEKFRKRYIIADICLVFNSSLQMQPSEKNSSDDEVMLDADYEI
jgi:hypothetical protein